MAILAGFKIDSLTQTNTTIPDKNEVIISGNSKKAFRSIRKDSIPPAIHPNGIK